MCKCNLRWWLCCQVAVVSRGYGFQSHGFAHSPCDCIHSLQLRHSSFLTVQNVNAHQVLWCRCECENCLPLKGPFAQFVWDDCVCRVWMQPRRVREVRVEEPISRPRRSHRRWVAVSHTSLGVMFWWVTFHPLEDVKLMQRKSCGKPVATGEDGVKATDCRDCVSVQTLRFEAGQLSSRYVSLFPLRMPPVVIYI